MMLVGMIAFWVVVGVAVLVIIAFGGAKPEGAPDDDDYETAALDLRRVDQGSVLTGYSPDEAARAYARMDRYEAEVAAMDDPKWRKAHMGWIRWSRDNIAEAEETWEKRQRVRQLKLTDPMN